VDCILNSLGGEFIPKSLEALAGEGRFVELGRIGIWTEAQVRQLRPDVRYFNFDMAQMCRDDPELIASLFKEIAASFQEHALEPIAHKLFPIQQAAAAFRFMAQAKHTGKIVLSHAHPDPAADEAPMIGPGGVYVITGGLGALGLQVAEWMVGKG